MIAPCLGVDANQWVELDGRIGGSHSDSIEPFGRSDRIREVNPHAVLHPYEFEAGSSEGGSVWLVLRVGESASGNADVRGGQWNEFVDALIAP